MRIHYKNLVKNDLVDLKLTPFGDNLMFMGTGSFFMAGVAPKRKGLGKQNFEGVKGWVNEKQNNSRVG
jgi:hypothetical protein